MKKCIFCKISEGEKSSLKVYEDNNFIAILDTKPIRDGHILLIPKEHHPYIFHLDDEQFISLLLKAKQLSSYFEIALNVKRIGMFVSGIAVPHTHLHLVPVNKQGDLDLHLAKKVIRKKLIEVQKKILSAIDLQ